MTTPVDFAHALLSRLGLPETNENIEALVAAQAIEGGAMANAATCNPLNTTFRTANSRSVTSVGVQAYPTWSEGLAATAATLTNGLYKPILSSLASSNPPDETLRAMALSPWGWYHLEGGQKVLNPIGSAASYQSYGLRSFPPGGGSLPSSSPNLLRVVAWTVLGIAGAYFVWSKIK